jgi:formyl-CoA transferase
LRGWIEDRTVKEVVDAMNAAQVGCSAIMTPKDMAEDPHYEMRDMHIQWEDFNVGRTVKGVGITPKMSLTPGQIWRGSVPMGYDNQLVLGDLLGLDTAELSRLQDEGII